MAESQNPRLEWWSAFPAPRAKCPIISVDDVMKLFDDMDIKPGPRQFLLVDVRKTDWEVCHARYQKKSFDVYCSLDSNYSNL
jgi:hypothetical protein